MKIKNKFIMYIMLVLSASNGCMVLANEVDIVDKRKQIKTEAQFDLLLAFIQKQTDLQGRLVAVQAATLMSSLALMGITISMMYDLLSIKQIMRR